MTTTATQISDETRLTMLKHLNAGKTLDQVATISRLDRDVVLDTVATHGYPKNLAKGIELLTAKIDRDRNTIPDGRPLPAANRTPVGAASTPAPTGTTSPRPASTSPSSVTSPDARPVGPPDEIRILLNTAKSHPSKRIQNGADGSVSSAELRAWAKTKGIDVPPVGRVPASVREQYAAEHQGEDRQDGAA